MFVHCASVGVSKPKLFLYLITCMYLWRVSLLWLLGTFFHIKIYNIIINIRLGKASSIRYFFSYLKILQVVNVVDVQQLHTLTNKENTASGAVITSMRAVTAFNKLFIRQIRSDIWCFVVIVCFRIAAEVYKSR